MEIVIVGNEVCEKRTEYCDLGHEHEEVLPLKHGPITAKAAQWNSTIAKMYSPITKEQLEANEAFRHIMGQMIDRKLDTIVFKVKE